MSDNKLTTIQALVVSTINQIEDILKKLKERIGVVADTKDITVEDVKPEDLPVDMTVEINDVKSILNEMDFQEEYSKYLASYKGNSFCEDEDDEEDYDEDEDDDNVVSEINYVSVKNGSGIRYKIKEFADGTIKKLKEKFTV
jgi:hypothetical protein